MFAWRKNEKRAAGGEEEEVEEERDKPSRRTDDGTAKKEKKGGITCELRARRPEGYFSPFLFVCLLFCFLFWGSKCLDLIRCCCRSQPGLRGGTHKHTHTYALRAQSGTGRHVCRTVGACPGVRGCLRVCECMCVCVRVCC